MDIEREFPDELWLEMFAHLSLDGLRNVSSTHRALYDIARPLGFIQFKLYPYPHDFQPAAAQLDDALQRLDFWSSPKTASYVRVCTARTSGYRWPGSAQGGNQGSPHVLMSTFFECLPRFIGLQKIYADGIHFTQTGIAALCELPALTHVELSACSVAAGENLNRGSLTLRVATFYTRYNDDDLDFWISLLSRDSLQDLDLPHLLGIAHPAVLPFPNVHTLHVNSLPMMMLQVLPILSKFPGVRVYHTTNYGAVLRNSPVEALTLFPVLEKYIGSLDDLHIFIRWTTLTHITLQGGYPFQRFQAQLQGVTTLPNITSLTARVTTSSQDVFGQTEIDALFTLFPRLTELELTVMPDEEEDSTSFLKMLSATATLPASLQSLSLDWDFPYNYGSTDSAAGNDPAPPDRSEIPDFTVLRGDIRVKCPALKYLFLNGYHFLFLWRISDWDGTEREATAYSYDGGEVIRCQEGLRIDGPPVLIS
ncbi:hypothetical protein DFH06DRAFT_1467286 [Mycena polygramma]|nr:hypothetical protein DFH06DRAFT_1467286 [Mycena polygramma]